MTAAELTEALKFIRMHAHRSQQYVCGTRRDNFQLAQDAISQCLDLIAAVTDYHQILPRCCHTEHVAQIFTAAGLSLPDEAKGEHERCTSS